MIGDPSGKSEERNLLSVEVLQANVAATWSAQIAAIPRIRRRRPRARWLPNNAILVNNYDWMSRFSFLEFLRDIGKNFPVNVMLAKDSVRSRLERTDSGQSYP